MAKETVAVLGTGIMGGAIARNLVRAGLTVNVWNRTRAKAARIEGATVAERPADAAVGAAVVLTVLPDADAVAETMEEDGVFGAMERDAVWIQHSTVGVDGAERLGELAREHGVVYVDAPLVGTREPAEKGELIVLASGPEDVREKCRPVFDAIGRETRWLGAAGLGSRLKMVVNMWLLAVTEAGAEAVALAEGLGLDPREFLDAVSGGPLDVPYLHMKSDAILGRDLEPSFKLELAAKDARLVLEAARRAGVDARVARAVFEAFETAVEMGYGGDDMAAAYFATAGGSG